VTATSSTKSTEIQVSDTGIGMTRDAMAKLFRVGTARSTPGTEGETGTGLGLILCHDLIDKNGGQLRVESEPGKGTAFTVSLPKG